MFKFASNSDVKLRDDMAALSADIRRALQSADAGGFVDVALRLDAALVLLDEVGAIHAAADAGLLNIYAEPTSE